MDMMLTIQNAEFWYESGRDIFRDVSFSVEKGEILCILGPNGIENRHYSNVVHESYPSDRVR